MNLKDFPQPSDVYRDEVVVFGAYALARLAVLVDAEDPYAPLRE